MVFANNLLLLSHVLVVFSAHIEANSNYLRIIGGRNVTDNEFTFAVRLALQNLQNATSVKFVGSAIAITPRWMLTAAHCNEYLDKMIRNNQFSHEALRVKAILIYQPSLKGDTSYSDILSTVSYPDTTIREPVPDIGLVNTQPIDITAFAKLSAIDFTALEGQEVTLVGYGATRINFANKIAPSTAQALEVVVKRCSEELYGNICFARACDTRVASLCPGDSGGGVIHTSGVVGVTVRSDHRECSIPRRQIKRALSKRINVVERLNYVGVSTPVTPYLSWIIRLITAK